MQDTAVDSGSRSLDRDGNGGGNQWQRLALNGFPPFRELVWADAEGAFLGQQAQVGPHFETRRPLPANVADAWGAGGTAQGHAGARTLARQLDVSLRSGSI